MQRLIDILSLKRGHNSIGERKFIDQILMPYAPAELRDAAGETMAFVISVPVSDTTPPPPILFTCHTDTVHDPKADAKQLVLYDTGTELMYKSDGAPLGADDGAGVWLLLEMIDASVPGTYIFFRGEERGGIGSKWCAKHHADWFQRFKYAIAFDRRDTCSVITHQSWGRCCSDAFATAFGSLISDPSYTLAPDDTGVYTDTAELVRLIPECTNISTGYYNEHGKEEILDVEYLMWLRQRMIMQGDLLCQLPAVRDPHAVELREYNFTAEGWGSGWNERVFTDEAPLDEFDVCNMRHKDVVRWVERAAPEDVADLLCSMAEQLVYTPTSTTTR